MFSTETSAMVGARPRDVSPDLASTDAGQLVEQLPRHFSKTRMCKFHILGMCTKGPLCPFAHCQDELRPTPDLTRTKLCKVLIETGICKNPKCTYAHNKDELRMTSAYIRTKLCKFALSGGCSLGAKCNFAHDKDELRDLDMMLVAPSTQPESRPMAEKAAPRQQRRGRAGAKESTQRLAAAPYAAEPVLRSDALMEATLASQYWWLQQQHLWQATAALSEASTDAGAQPDSADGSARSPSPGDVAVVQSPGSPAGSLGTSSSRATALQPMKLVRSAEGDLCAMGEERRVHGPRGLGPRTLKLVRSAEGALCAMGEE